jgi:hypothetical protein
MLAAVAPAAVTGADHGTKEGAASPAEVAALVPRPPPGPRPLGLDPSIGGEAVSHPLSQKAAARHTHTACGRHRPRARTRTSRRVPVESPVGRATPVFHGTRL